MWQSRDGESGRDGADDGDSLLAQVQQSHRTGRADHADQGHRRAWGHQAAGQHHGQGDQSERERRGVHRTEMAYDVGEFGPEAVGCHVDPGELAELGDDHDHRDPGHVADEHRAGKEIGKEAQPSEPPEHTESRHHQAQCGREIGVFLRPGGGNCSNGGCGQQRGGRLGTHRELAGGPEQGVGEECADRRPQPDDRGQPGNLGVRHHLGDEIRRDGHAREDVAAKPASSVAHGPRRSRNPPGHGLNLGDGFI